MELHGRWGRRWRGALAAVALAALLAPPPLGAAQTQAGLVDINQASSAELAALPGIGEAKAQAIVDHRAAAPFQRVEDLKQVQGIGDRTFEALRSSITVGEEQ